MADFINSEKDVIEKFPVGTNFILNGKTYTVSNIGKPSPSNGRGEPKTDVYIKANSANDEIELKISIKQTNADFLENKMTKDRIIQVFGKDWNIVVFNCIDSIRSNFYNKKLIFKAKSGRVREGSMTLGWRFEIANKNQGELSGLLPLDKTPQYYREVLSGDNLEEGKRNSKVNGVVIQNSGVAEYILEVDKNERFPTAQEIIDNIELINDYIIDKKLYFTCKASNVLIKPAGTRKVEGNRALSVYLKWIADNGRLNYSLNFDKPFDVKGQDVIGCLNVCLSQLNIITTDNINNNNISNPNIIHS